MRPTSLFAVVHEDDASLGSKVFMNRLVEQTGVPMIWITNDIAHTGSAVVRRMNLVMRFPRPDVAVQERIVEPVASRAKFNLETTASGQLALLPAAPALIENAILSAAFGLSGPPGNGKPAYARHLAAELALKIRTDVELFRRVGKSHRRRPFFEETALQLPRSGFR
jgi:hypothetical protein